MTKTYIGLGTNIGDRQANLKHALKLIAQEIEITDMSPIYETKPEGYLNQPDFLNCVIGAETNITPEKLFNKLKKIEGKMGRKPSFINAPRVIDLDILSFGDEIVDGKDLKIPHPRIHERAFVLIPLCDIAPDLTHPVKGKTMQKLLDELRTASRVENESR